MPDSLQNSSPNLGQKLFAAALSGSLLSSSILVDLTTAPSIAAPAQAVKTKIAAAPAKPATAKVAADNAGGDNLNLVPGAKPGDNAVLDHVRLLNNDSALSDRADMLSLHNYLVSAIAAVIKYFNNSKRGRPLGLSIQANIAPGGSVLYELQVRPVERQQAKMGVELTELLEKLKPPSVTGPVGVQILMKVFYPKPEVSALLKKGIDFQKADKNKEAVAAYTQAAALDPTNIEIYLCRGMAYNGTGEYDKAVADLSKAVDLGAKDAFLNRSVAYRHLAQYDKALDDCNKAIEVEPEYWECYQDRALVYQTQGNFDDAIKDCDKALSLMQACAMAYLIRGECRYSKKDYDNSVRDLSMAIQMLPRSGEAYYYRGLASDGLGRSTESAGDSQKAKDLGYQPPAK